MQLPFTEKFLWEIYKLIENIDKSYDLFAPKSMKYALCPGLYSLRRSYEKQKARTNFSKFINYLKANRYIKIKELENKSAIALTPKGARKVLKIKLNTEREKAQKRKDGKWQMVIFDIPEHKKKTRDIFRKYLRYLGYQPLQKSIWVCPFDVYEETKNLVENYFITPCVRFFLIEEVDLD